METIVDTSKFENFTKNTFIIKNIITMSDTQQCREVEQEEDMDTEKYDFETDGEGSIAKETSEKETSEKEISEKETSEKETSEKETSEKETSEKDLLLENKITECTSQRED